MHKFGVCIGRFQPIHNAHLKMIKFALERAEKLVIIIGSFNQARNVKNPWTGPERVEMIKGCLSEKDQERVIFVPIRDYLYNDNLWITEVQEQIYQVVESCDDVILVGHKKDDSSYYLKMFPKWTFIETGEFWEPLNATDIRVKYFTGDVSFVKDVPESVGNKLKKVCGIGGSTDKAEATMYQNLSDEFQHIRSYREAWRGAPFPPTFVTTDAIVIKSGHVLVVRRKGNPGKGLIALPGGFLNANEKILDGAIRELKEETGIKVLPKDLKEAVCNKEVFDHPERSLRGRTITHAFCIDLGMGELPLVKGMDDADKAWWMPLRDVFARENEFFEDHFHIIAYFVNKF